MKGQRIAILGCGPGGMAAALFLHKAGHHPVIFEEFETPRPIGSGLLVQPSGQAVLDRLGLLPKIRELGSPVTRLFGISVGPGKRALDMQYANIKRDAAAIGIHRANLFDVLYDAITTNKIEIRTGCQAIGAQEHEDGIAPIFNPAIKPERFDLLVDASGTNSPLASGTSRNLPFSAFWTNVDMPVGTTIGQASLDQRYHRASQMAGIMPIGINPATRNQGAALFWSVAHGSEQAIYDRGIDKWREDFLQLWPEADAFVSQIHSFDALTLAVYKHRTGHPALGRRIFYVGDSWHSTSPQLGQGANMALIDATAFAKALEMADNIGSIAPTYNHYRAGHVRLYQMLSAIFTPMYQSDSVVLPAARDFMIHNFARWPVVRNLIAQIVSGQFASAHI
jgi:salicylate hydroxylase